MKSNILAFRKQLPSPFFLTDKNIFPFLETFLKIFNRIDCYCYYDFPDECDQCPDNRLCFIFHIADLEATGTKKVQKLFEQEETIQKQKDEIKSLREEIQWLYSGG
jgi:hypothetical protein